MAVIFNKDYFLIFARIWNYLGRRRKKQIIILILLIIISAFCEVFSFAAVIPFLAIVTSPENFLDNRLIVNFLNIFSISSLNNVIFLVSLFFISVVILSGFIRTLNLWLSNRLAALIGNDLSCNSFKSSLMQPYKVQVLRDSSEVISIATVNSERAVTAITHFIYLITALFISICIITTIFIFKWKLAICLGFISTFIYILFAFFTKNRLIRNSKNVVSSYSNQIKSIQETFGSIRDIILNNSYITYLELHKTNDLRFRFAISQSKFLGNAPRYIFETIGLVILASLGYFLTRNNNDSTEVIEILGITAVGANKLLPMFQQVYASWAGISACIEDLRKVLDNIDQAINNTVVKTKEDLVFFNKSIKFENVFFRYQNQNADNLKNINLTINKGERIGLIGHTGSGKSTIVDLMMGLLSPTKGKIIIDDINLKTLNQIKSWCSLISHVPQSIYLSNKTILENIAFGIPKSKINIEYINYVSKKARIFDFVQSLPNKFDTKVGERGVRLSGGQRQRIGIARALYNKKKILVLDEATSALDNNSERLIIDSIKSLSEEITIIMIAHRLSSIKFCDRVVQIENGSIKRICKGSEINS